MTKIEATEESFGRANNFYILSWVITSLLIVTAFVEFRSYNRELNINNALISHYSNFEKDVAEVASFIRSAIYLAPSYSNENQGLESIRQLRSKVLAHVDWFKINLTARKPNIDIKIEEEITVRKNLNYMKNMLLLNDAVSLNHAVVKDEPALLLAEHESGSYLVPEKIEDLRVEDAARYLWLSTLQLHHWSSVLSKHQRALEKNIVLSDISTDFTNAVLPTTSQDAKNKRQTAKEIWVKWIKSATASAIETVGGDQEVRKRRSMTLAQSTVFLGQAYQKSVELDLRAGGESSTVEIPVLSIPLQLRDAIFAAPWLIVFCSLSILIYTMRALHCAPKSSNNSEVVGNIPGFYAFHGLGKNLGTCIAILLLLLPPILLGFLLPLFVPTLIVGLSVHTVTYFGGLLLSFTMGIFTLGQIPYVAALIDEGNHI